MILEKCRDQSHSECKGSLFITEVIAAAGGDQRAPITGITEHKCECDCHVWRSHE